jgi:hypothetical protein
MAAERTLAGKPRLTVDRLALAVAFNIHTVVYTIMRNVERLGNKCEKQV